MASNPCDQEPTATTAVLLVTSRSGSAGCPQSSWEGTGSDHYGGACPVLLEGKKEARKRKQPENPARLALPGFPKMAEWDNIPLSFVTFHNPALWVLKGPWREPNIGLREWHWLSRLWSPWWIPISSDRNGTLSGKNILVLNQLGLDKNESLWSARLYQKCRISG